MNRLRRKDKKQQQEAVPTTPSQQKTTATLQQHQENDIFEARRSTRITSSSSVVKADGDTWCETLAVCQVKGKLTIRSYYTNQRTSDRIWDEPPSGASKVEHATDEMRKMANIQLAEIEIADIVTTEDTTSEEEETKKKQKRGLLFGRSSNKTKQPNKGKIQYKRGSALRNRKPHPDTVARNEAMDPHVQAAIALSMADQSGRSSSYQANKTAEYQDEADEEIAMAMALSLSENTNNNAEPQDENDDLLGLASVPREEEDDPVIVATVGPSFDDENGDLLGFNQKPPASQQPRGVQQQQPRSNLKQWPPIQAKEEAPSRANLKTWPPPEETQNPHTVV